MKKEGKIKGMVYEATLKEGSRIYRVFQEDKLLAECNAKELRYMPKRLMEEGLHAIADDLIDTLPNLKRCTCVVCGSEFIGAASRNYTCSSKCYEEKHKIREREAYVKRVGGRRPEHKKDLFSEHSKEARRLGMSYGKYKAMLFIQQGGARVEI